MTKSFKLSIPAERAERLHYIRRMFPQATGVALGDDWRGGRQEAQKRINTLDVVAYTRNRNFLNGSVSKLSPYFRHGCITLKEASDNVRNRFGEQSQKFVQELAWRDYWRRVWYQLGNGFLHYLAQNRITLTKKI